MLELVIAVEQHRHRGSVSTVIAALNMWSVHGHNLVTLALKYQALVLVLAPLVLVAF